MKNNMMPFTVETREEAERFLEEEHIKIKLADNLADRIDSLRFKIINPMYYILMRRYVKVVDSFRL